jgi:hypothetical protein
VNQLTFQEEDDKIAAERIKLIKAGKCKTIKSTDMDWYVCQKKSDDFLKYNAFFGKSKFRTIALSSDHIVIGNPTNKDGALINVKPSKVFQSKDLFQVIMGLSKKSKTLDLILFFFNEKMDCKLPPRRAVVVFEWEESRKFIPVMQKHFERYAVNLTKVEDVSLD